MSETVLTTAVVGSYPQPEWLIDRDNLVNRLPPRVRAHEIWRIPPEHLEEAQEAATLAAIRDQERAGVDVISDGEIRRESYSNRVATALGAIGGVASLFVWSRRHRFGAPPVGSSHTAEQHPRPPAPPG